MRTEIYTCDCCRKEVLLGSLYTIQFGGRYHSVTIVTPQGSEQIGDCVPVPAFDVCLDCANKILSLLHSKIVQ